MHCVLTGGGTGGHVFPALAIAQELQARGHSVLYIGSDRGMEARLAPEKGVRFVAIRTGPVKNQSLFRIVRTCLQLVGATIWSIRVLAKERAQAVIGVGGYVSVPVCLAAFVLRKPIFLQEQNVSVGIANRALGKLCRRVFLGFGEAARYFPVGRSVESGNPIRAEFFAPRPAYDPFGKRLLVLGGSQGARAINQALAARLGELPSDWHITHQTGRSDADAIATAYRQHFKGPHHVAAFIEDVAEAMAQATVVISRSGAITVSELVQLGRPCILVPFPRQGQNDQTDNARWLERHGCALVVEQGEGFEQRLFDAWRALQVPEKRAQMAAAFSALRRPPAIATIVGRIEKELA